MSDCIGVDVGGTNLRVGVVRDHEVVWEHRYQADFSGICRRHDAVEAIRKIIAELVSAVANARSEHSRITSVGIGFPGFIDPASGVVLQSPNLPGLSNIDIAGPLAQQLGLPVIVENDALAAAWGEYLLAEPRPDSMIYLGLGTGVGGGLILHGKPYAGEHGVAMEVGHIIVHPGGRLCGCGNHGCLERYASASGVVISYQELSGKALEADLISSLAARDDPHAQGALRIAAESLAVTLAHILKVVDVAHVVIGGGLSAAWPQMQSEFEACLEAALIPALRGRISVVLAQAGDRAGMLGAAQLPGLRTAQQ
jgi:glucokinase